MGKTSEKKSRVSDKINVCKDSLESSQSLNEKNPNLKYYLALGVSLITFLVYLASLQNEFVNWDDHVYVFENPNIRLLNLNFFKWAFLDFHEGNWHPLTWISHALDYALWGLNPLGHHLTNNILHTANTFLVVLLVVKLIEAASTVIPACPESFRSKDEETPRPKKGRFTESPLQKNDSRRVPTCSEGAEMTNGFSLWTDGKAVLIAAATTGLLFGLHPLHVESVAWVSERKDLLCGLFILLSIMMYLKYRGKTASCLNNVRSHHSRESGNPEKGNWIPGQARNDNQRKLTEISPLFNKHYLQSLAFFILALLSKPMAVSLPAVLLILDWYPLKRILSLKTSGTALKEKIPFVALSLVSSILTILAQKAEGALGVIAPSLSARISVAAKSLIAYLYNMIVPLQLTPVYPYPKDVSILSLQYFLSTATVIGITIICAAAARRQRLWLSVWGYYLITLLPVIGLVQVGSQSMADRYTYLPSIGPFLLAGLGAAQVSTNIRTVKKQGALTKLFPVSIAIFVVVSMSYLTFRQIGIWENGITLWSHVIENKPKGDIKAYINRGIMFQVTGQLDKAISDFDKAIELNPANLGIYLNPSIYYEAYLRRGQVFEKKGDLHRALADFNKVSELNSSFIAAYLNRAGLFERSGHIDNAMSELDKAIALTPTDYATYIERGILYGKYLSLDKAIEQFSLVIYMNPNYASSFCNRGWAYSLIGQNEKGLQDLNKAIELDPNYTNAYFYRGNLYLSVGNKELAVTDFQKACDLGEQGGCTALKQYAK